MYELPASLLSANPLNRYLLNSPMSPQFKRDAGGGLTLLIQNEAPARTRKPTGCPRRRGRWSWPCASTGRKSYTQRREQAFVRVADWPPEC